MGLVFGAMLLIVATIGAFAIGGRPLGVILIVVCIIFGYNYNKELEKKKEGKKD